MLAHISLSNVVIRQKLTDGKQHPIQITYKTFKKFTRDVGLYYVEDFDKCRLSIMCNNHITDHLVDILKHRTDKWLWWDDLINGDLEEEEEE